MVLKMYYDRGTRLMMDRTALSKIDMEGTPYS